MGFPIVAAATDCSSRVGRSLKMSRSPDLSLASFHQWAQVMLVDGLTPALSG